MESPTVTNINAVVQYRNNARITLDIVFKINEKEHIFKLVVDKLNMDIKVQLDSPCLGHYEVSAEVKNVDNFYQVKSQAILQGFETDLIGNITLNSCLNFNGNLNLKLLPHQGNIDFKAILDNSRDSTLDLDLTTTHPKFDRIRLQFNMVQNSLNGYSGSLQTIIPLVEDTKIEFKVPGTNVKENEATFSVSNLNGHADIQCKWNLQDLDKDVKVLVHYPEGGKLSVEMKVKNNEGQLTLTSSHFEKIDLKVKWSPEMNLKSGFVYADFDVLDEKLNVDLTYQMESDKEVKLSIDTSFEGYEVRNYV